MFYTPNSIKTKFICRLSTQPMNIMNDYLNHFRGNRNTLKTKAIYLGNVFYVHVCWQQQNFSDSLTIIILAAILTFNLRILHSQTILYCTVMCLLSSFDFFCTIDFFPAENLIHCARIAFIS